MEGWDRVLQKAVYALNQHPIYSIVSPIARIHKYRNQGVEKGIVIPSDPLGKFLFPVPTALNPVDLEIWLQSVECSCQEPKQAFH